jgi:hypothetical protein
MKYFNNQLGIINFLYFSSARYFNRGERDVSNSENNNLPVDCIDADGNRRMYI